MKALDEASKAVRAAKELKTSPKPKPDKTIYAILKENKENSKHLDPVDEKRKCPHPQTSFFCQLCASAKVPSDVIKHAVNYGKSPKQDNEGLKALRGAYKFQKSPRNN